MPVPIIKAAVKHVVGGPSPFVIPGGTGYGVAAGGNITYRITVDSEYLWNYYASAPPAYTDTAGGSGSAAKSGTVYYAAAYTFNAGTGNYSLTSPSSASVSSKPTLTNLWFSFGAATASEIYYNGSISGFLVYTASWASKRTAVSGGLYPAPVDAPLGSVSDADYDAYPHHGPHSDNYYYIRDCFVWKLYQNDRYLSGRDTVETAPATVAVSSGTTLYYADDYSTGSYSGGGSGLPYTPAADTWYELDSPSSYQINSNSMAYLPGKYWMINTDDGLVMYYGCTSITTGGGLTITAERKWELVPEYSDYLYPNSYGTVYDNDYTAYPANGFKSGETTPKYVLVP